MVRVLFVCMGNICRSPTAEGVFRHLVDDAGLASAIETDSAGTHGFHIGEPPDPRAQEAARARGFDISDIRSRRVESGDLEAFDYVLAMDERNLQVLRDMAAHGDRRDRVYPFLQFTREHLEREVPDPYYGPHGGFEFVLDLIEDASAGLLERIRRDHKL